MTDDDVFNGSLSLMVEGDAQWMPPDIVARMTRAFDRMVADGVNPVSAMSHVWGDPDCDGHAVIVWTFPPDCYVVVRLCTSKKGYIEIVETTVAAAMPEVEPMSYERGNRRLSLVLFECCHFEYGPRELVLWIAALHKPHAGKEPNLVIMARGRGKQGAPSDSGIPVSDLKPNGRKADHA